MNRHNLYLSGIILITALFARSMAALASYFLGHQNLHQVSAALVLILAFLFAFFIVGKFLKTGKWAAITLVSLLIIQSASVFLFYWLRPYTLYYSVLLFSNIFISGVLSGLFASFIIERSAFRYNRIYILLVLIVMSVFVIPAFYNLNLIPIFLAFGFLGIYTLYLLQENYSLYRAAIPAVLFLLLGISYPKMPDIVFFENQQLFEDKIVYSAESEHFDITITQWMDDYWLYLDRLKNISTIDEFLYYEPFVHATAPLNNPERILVLGGENGCLVRELLKYSTVNRIDIIPYDTTLLTIARKHPVLLKMNDNSLNCSKVRVMNNSILSYITTAETSYDLIYIDTPDPRNLETNQFYTREFYEFLKHNLTGNGLVVTQAGSPYFATKAFYSIQYTMQAAGYQTFPLHNQILTLGEWGWIIGSLSLSSDDLAHRIPGLETFSSVNTRWLNQEALSLITSFGKKYIEIDSLEINTLDNPIVYRYYLEGTWDLE